MSRETGAIPIQVIKELISVGAIKSNLSFEDNVQPCSLDLRVSDEKEIIRLPGIFLPQSNGIYDFALKISKDNCLYQARLRKNGFTLEVGVPYLIPLSESLNLPKGVCGKANNKSSSGRVNLQVRLICDGHQSFDIVPDGYSGPLYIIAVAQSFPINITAGEKLNQLRLFRGNMLDSKLNTLSLELQHRQECLVYNENGVEIPWEGLKIVDVGIALTANLVPQKKENPIAYRFKGTPTHALRFDSRDCNSSDFFEPIYKPKGNLLVLAKGGFYIISTSESLSIPPHLCSEMVAYKTETGEYRSHFAGFFDPGWGYGRGLKGAPAVLEVIPHEDILIYHKQPICVMDMSHMLEKPEVIYGDGNNNYLNQNGPRLSKHFK